MDDYERAEMIDRLQAEVAEEQIELAARRERNLGPAGDLPPDWRGKTVTTMSRAEFSAWCDAGKPSLQPDRVPLEQMQKMVAQHEADQRARQDAAELHRFIRETRQYRDGLEKALGEVIRDQRKETAALRDEIDKLRADLKAMRGAAATPSVRRLVQSPRTIGHAVSA